MTIKAAAMVTITIVTIIAILLSVTTKDIATTVGNVGAGIILILGIGFSFLIAQKEK